MRMISAELRPPFTISEGSSCVAASSSIGLNATFLSSLDESSREEPLLEDGGLGEEINGDRSVGSASTSPRLFTVIFGSILGPILESLGYVKLEIDDKREGPLYNITRNETYAIFVL